MSRKIVTAGSLSLIAVMIMATIVFAAITPIDFTGFTGAGYAPSPAAGQLDSALWRVTGMSDGDGAFGGTHTSGDFARGADPGGVTTGGIYSFDTGGGNATQGVQPGGSDFTPGDITLKIENTTGSTVADVYVSYDIWTFNDQARANSLNFAWSTDDAAYTAVPALDYTTPEVADPVPAWVNTPRSTTLTGVNLASGAFIYLQWQSDDVSGSGSRDEFAIDNIEARIRNSNAITLSTLSATGFNPGILALALATILAIGAGAFVLRRRALL